MEKMVFRKAMLLAFLFSLSCALEGEARVNEEMRDDVLSRGVFSTNVFVLGVILHNNSYAM
ncbi:hypothetical protein HID58_022892 [Brassica napus]|uniref:Uncharacterized protein n=1 Tax=Brassica napus TaxID=3708 RepID=A0ABQ8D0I6_BRANA|nr:hypothetical protein HID58_022892 [Brassica napus]